jgi:hypothetical protein
MRNDGKLHFSALKNIGLSPLHFDYFERNQREDSEAFLLGRATHAWVLQGIVPRFWPERRAGKAYQDAVAENNGEDLLNASQFALVESMANAVNRSALACSILSQATQREADLTWTRRGIECAARLDAFGKGITVELKTGQTAHPKRFQWDGKKYGYREQLAWYDYARGVRPDPFESKWNECYVIAVESKAPFPVSVHRIMPLALQQANSRVEEWLDRYVECKALSKWPGWDSDVTEWDADLSLSPDEDSEE